jgi:hypothetical protein
VLTAICSGLDQRRRGEPLHHCCLLRGPDAPCHFPASWSTLATLPCLKHFAASLRAGGPCAGCTKPPGSCGRANPCKGKRQYTCSSSPCSSQQVFDDGSRVRVGLCGAVYYSEKTGFPAAACMT